jgi:hypothetical protein
MILLVREVEGLGNGDTVLCDLGATVGLLDQNIPALGAQSNLFYWWGLIFDGKIICFWEEGGYLDGVGELLDSLEDGGAGINTELDLFPGGESAADRVVHHCRFFFFLKKKIGHVTPIDRSKRSKKFFVFFLMSNTTPSRASLSSARGASATPSPSPSLTSSSSSSINVSIRIRPLLPSESQEPQCLAADGANTVIDDEGRPHSFDLVFGPHAVTVDVYARVASPIISACFEGFNGTVFVYGQTSSGKTHTMSG